MFKAFSDENRVLILNSLKTGEKMAGMLLESLQITQPTLSHHMKILCDAGLVLGRRRGRWTHYSLMPKGLDMAQAYLDELRQYAENKE